jgi:hypothetical protein
MNDLEAVIMTLPQRISEHLIRIICKLLFMSRLLVLNNMQVLVITHYKSGKNLSLYSPGEALMDPEV